MYALKRILIACAAAALVVVSSAGVVAGGESSAGHGGSSRLNPIAREQLRDLNALYASPWTVNPGHAQIETYVLQYARDHDRGRREDTARETWTFGPMTIKAGLLNNLDAEITITPYTRVRTREQFTGKTKLQQGYGDVFAGVKYNIFGNDGGRHALAALPFIKLPTSQDGLGNDFVEGGVVVPIAFELPRGWWLILGPEADVSHDVFSSGYHVDFANTVYFCHSIVGNLSGYADFYSWISTERNARPLGIVDFGLSYAWSKNVQIDAGISMAVTKLGDDVNPYLGFSFRF